MGNTREATKRERERRGILKPCWQYISDQVGTKNEAEIVGVDDDGHRFHCK